MSNLTLFRITNDFQALMNQVEEGEITEEEYNALGEKLATELQNKSTNIVGYIQNEAILIEAIDSQITRLQELKKVKENKLNNFKKYVKEQMTKINLPKVETELGTLSIAKSPISIEIINEDKIANEYKKIVQQITIDKTKIKEHYKETGETIEGVKINTNNTYLKVK